jgi:hypothetical protein
LRRSSIRRYLLLCALSQPDIAQSTSWRRIYLANRYVSEQARRLHVRLSTPAIERSRVRSLIVTASPDDPLRTPALDWSRKE